MSNTLREAIKQAVDTNTEWDEIVDAILDAVIASLPSLNDYDDTDPYQQGYMWARGQMLSNLLSAKSTSKESE